MKAKEYAEKYNLEPDKDKAILDLIFGLLREGQDIIKQRNVKKNSAVMSILREQNLKWKSCCNIINKQDRNLQIALNGYEMILKDEMGIEI